MPVRHEYLLNLERRRKPPRKFLPPGVEWRSPSAKDIDRLADLMMDAYENSIDFKGDETIDDALNELNQYFSGEWGEPIIDCSRVGVSGSELVSACLAGYWTERDSTLIYWVMTRSYWKNQGLGAALLNETLERLSDAGHKEVRAIITEGNIQSETICQRAGFVRV